MALAEHLGLNPRDVRTFGVAGLLHDLGKVKIPMEILNKPGKLTDEERSVMQGHTVEGARLIITSDRELDLEAPVAYEHHIMIEGGGYTKRRTTRCAPTVRIARRGRPTRCSPTSRRNRARSSSRGSRVRS
jgi:HD-GYP domain-containing protein (c-di-GMP phosphodiesterase class II)